VPSDDASFKKRKNGKWWGVPFRPESIMRILLTEFLSSESGVTAIEYGLIVVGISLAIVATVNALGVSLNTPFQNSAAGMNP
jgi:pilus assembly protein Flp/PilA